MAKVSLQVIKNWFKTALKPTQEQFWSTWDSFWHKDDLIPAASIENLDNRFDEKADNDALQSHLNDDDAHSINQKLAGKVDTNQLTAEATARENADAYLQGQIDGLSMGYYKGTFPSLAALESAYPLGDEGDEALVDAGVGTDALKYLWDQTDGKWILGGGKGASTFFDLTGSPDDNAALAAKFASKQTSLQSGINIKTINGTSVLGNGDIVIENDGVGITEEQLNDAIGGVRSLITGEIVIPLLRDITGVSAAYGIARIVPSATKCVRIRRNDDNREIDFHFGSDGRLIVENILSFLDGQQGRISVFYDQSGNNNHAIQTDRERQPFIAIEGSLVSIRFVLGYPGNLNVSLTNSLQSNNMAVFAAYSCSVSSGILSTTGGFDKRYLFSANDQNFDLYINGLTPNYDSLNFNAISSVDMYAASSRNHIAYNSSPNGGTLYSNYFKKDFPAIAPKTVSTIRIADGLLQDSPIEGDCFCFVVFSESKSDAEFQTLISRSEQSFDLINPNNCPANIVFDGDSITYGSAAVMNRGFVNQLASLKRQSFYNLGISNNTYPYTMPKGVARTDKLIISGKKNILVVFLGTNDIFNFNRTGQQVYDDAVLYAQQRKTAGYTSIIVLTCLPRSGGNTDRDTLNSLLLANTTDFDHVVNVGGDPVFKYKQAALQEGLLKSYNPLYFSDGTHPTTEGHRIIAGYLDPILDRYINGNDSEKNIGQRLIAMENQLKALSRDVIYNRAGRQKGSLGVTDNIYASGVYANEETEAVLKIGGNSKQGSYYKGHVEINPVDIGNGTITFNAPPDYMPKNQFLFKKNSYNKEIGDMMYVGPENEFVNFKIGYADKTGQYDSIGVILSSKGLDAYLNCPQGRLKLSTVQQEISLNDRLVLGRYENVKINDRLVLSDALNHNPVTASAGAASTHKIQLAVGDTVYYLLATTAP